MILKTKKIAIPIYRGHLTMIFDKNLKYVQKKYKTVCLKNYGAVTLKDPEENRHYVVAFEYSDGSIIAHEIVHIINYIYTDCGIHFDRDNDEHTAYLTGWLFEEIEKFLKDKA